MKEKVNELKQCFQGKDCLIITAGPTLENTCKNKLREIAAGKVVIAVKQAYYFLPDIVDLHVINDNNYEVYSYKNAKKNLKVILLKSPSIISFTPKCDPFIRFEIRRENCIWEKSIVSNKNFEEYEINEDSLDRPWGPGIMYEICIYFPVLFSSRKVIFVSWDLGSSNTNIINRYNENQGFLKNLHNYLICKFPYLYNKFYIKIENILRILLFIFGIKVKVGLPAVTKNEAIKISESSEFLSLYYFNKNIEHFVFSDQSLLHENFKRL